LIKQQYEVDEEYQDGEETKTRKVTKEAWVPSPDSEAKMDPRKADVMRTRSMGLMLDESHDQVASLENNRYLSTLNDDHALYQFAYDLENSSMMAQMDETDRELIIEDMMNNHNDKNTDTTSLNQLKGDAKQRIAKFREMVKQANMEVKNTETETDMMDADEKNLFNTYADTLKKVLGLEKLKRHSFNRMRQRTDISDKAREQLDKAIEDSQLFEDSFKMINNPTDSGMTRFEEWKNLTAIAEPGGNAFETQMNDEVLKQSDKYRLVNGSQPSMRESIFYDLVAAKDLANELEDKLADIDKVDPADVTELSNQLTMVKNMLNDNTGIKMHALNKDVLDKVNRLQDVVNKSKATVQKQINDNNETLALIDDYDGLVQSDNPARFDITDDFLAQLESMGVDTSTAVDDNYALSEEALNTLREELQRQNE
jgi:hypothetical protein